MLNLNIAPKACASIVIKHPSGNGDVLGIFEMAGPDHEITLNRKRDLESARQDPSYKQDLMAEVKTTLCLRTMGWSMVKDEKGKDAPFDREALPALYSQEWMRNQVLEQLGGNEVFFKP